MHKQEKQKLQELINVLAEQEIHKEQQFLDEGMAEVMKAAWEKTKGAASAAWEGIKGKVTQATAGAKNIMTAKMAELAKAFPQAQQDFQQLKQIEAQSGEKLPVTPMLKMAAGLPNLVKSAKQEIASDTSASQALAKQAPPAPNTQQQQAQEAYVSFVGNLLKETTVAVKRGEQKKLNESSQKQLNEFGVTAAAGIALGAIGGVPLLLKGLYKLAAFLKMPKTSQAFQHAYHVAHHFEEKVIDYAVPDKLSYLWYTAQQKVVSKDGSKPLSLQEYSVSDVRKKVEMRIYKIALVYFMIHGLHGAMEAGLSLLGATEAAATTVKAVEIGTEVIEVASAIAGATGDAGV